MKVFTCIVDPVLSLIIAFHDAFELYGRPRSYTWDARDPDSLMFGYPVSPNKEVCPVLCLRVWIVVLIGSTTKKIGSVLRPCQGRVNGPSRRSYFHCAISSSEYRA